MPQQDFDKEYRLAIADYAPGYDWIPGRFGPPPGIPKARKDKFGKQHTSYYFHKAIEYKYYEDMHIK